MKREIKFRAWNPDGKKMEFPIVLGVGTDKILKPLIKCSDGNRAYKDYPLMQYTGLKDKNGNEIYEGDFDEDFQVVRWCDKRSGWALSIYDFPTKEHICCHCYNCEGNFDISDVIDDFEIKGNIYEHP